MQFKNISGHNLLIKMDAEDDTTAYLKFFNDPSNSYMLNGGEVGLSDSFAVEPIFTEIETIDWPSECFPVLLSGPLIAEDSAEKPDGRVPIDGQVNVIKNGVNPGDEGVSGDVNKTITSENLYLSNDVYFQINPEHRNSEEDLVFEQQCILDDDTSNVASNDNLEKTVYLNYDLQNITNENVYQILNPDGTLTAINKSVLNVLNILPEESASSAENAKKYEDYYSSITAQKCTVCNFLCESVDDIQLHLDEKHADLFPVKQVIKASESVVKNSKIKYITKMASILNTNNEQNKKMVLFVCSECNNGYGNKDDLKQHMISDHNLITSTDQDKMSSTSKTNEDKSKSIKSLSTFLIKKQQKALKRVKCSIKGCNLRFARDELRLRHEECHVGEQKKQFKCTVCDEKFSIWRICSNHLWTCHKIDLGLLTCPMCSSFKSNSSVRVLNHMAIHNEERPFLCNDCGKGFKQLAQLKNHEVFHKAPEDVPNWSSMKQCEICERYFANSKSLKKHVQFVHEKFKPFICNICGHKTARKAMLELHLRQHTGVKPHQCPYCTYKTGDHNCLRRHIMRHVGGKKYSCPHCNYTSIQSSSYKNHLAHKHPGKGGTYACTYCSYTTVNAAAYASHLKCHEVALKTSSDKGDMKTNGSNGAVVNQNSINSKADHLQDDIEDDETQNCFLNADQTEDTVDTGGITIPAGLEMHLVS